MEKNRPENDPYEALMNTLYDDRVNYTIVGLTGYSGTGCSMLSDIMCSKFSEWPDLRLPKDLTIELPKVTDNEDLMYREETNHKSIASTIFALKYKTCYNFSKIWYKSFEVIKYSYALMFLTLDYLINREEQIQNIEKLEDKVEPLKQSFKEILKDKYRPSREECDNDYRKFRNKIEDNKDFSYDGEGKSNFEWEIVQSLEGFESDWSQLIQAFSELGQKIKEDNNNADIIHEKKANLFFTHDSVFRKFVEDLNKYLWELDPYCTDFFYHRLGFVIRAVGDPLRRAHEVMHDKNLYNSHLYDVVSLINDLIKGYRKSEIRKEEQKGGKKVTPCRIVIDKIRNSLEAKFLKERYAAFYFIATHEEEVVMEHLKSRVEKIYKTQNEINRNRKLIDLQVSKIISLDAIEREGKDFESGKFFAPNISQCVADAEIHLSNEQGQGGNKAYFYSMSEQWMKYASLIQHPGLITPSSEERCMVVAYTAKFNSGCISRQVGAVITNKAHTIRSIGWNDVPYGQIPCSLRDLEMMATGKGDVLNIRKYVYSDYEIGGRKTFKDGETFNDKVRIRYSDYIHGKRKYLLMEGLPSSYCFKSLQNDFEQQKNQVHTRSLHAEENAILQMAKYGGEGLYQGIIYVTASPCELCCKKLYQIGVRKIVYIDEYPGSSRENIIASGYHRPKLKQFQGAYGATYFKLYQPMISYKEEVAIRRKELSDSDSSKTKEKNIESFEKLCKEKGVDLGKEKLSQDALLEVFKTIVKKD